MGHHHHPSIVLPLSLTIIFGSFTLGFYVAIQGPTLMDLIDLLHVNNDIMSHSLAVASLAYSVGGLLSGLLFNYVDRQILIPGYYIVFGLSNILTPYITNYYVFSVVTVFKMMCAGGTDCGANVWILDMWPGKDAWLQALHFSFAVGCALGPLVVEPFLSANEHKTNLEESNLAFVAGSAQINNENGESRIYIPYGVSGSFSLLAAFLIIFLYFLEARRKRAEAALRGESPACQLQHQQQQHLALTAPGGGKKHSLGSPEAILMSAVQHPAAIEAGLGRASSPCSQVLAVPDTIPEEGVPLRGSTDSGDDHDHDEEFVVVSQESRRDGAGAATARSSPSASPQQVRRRATPTPTPATPTPEAVDKVQQEQQQQSEEQPPARAEEKHEQQQQHKISSNSNLNTITSGSNSALHSASAVVQRSASPAHSLQQQHQHAHLQQLRKLSTSTAAGAKPHSGLDQLANFDQIKFTSKAREADGRPPYYVMLAIALSALCLSFYCGIEITSMNYLATFAVNIDLQLPKSSAALMSSALTISFAVGRLFGIWIAAHMRPHKLFYLCSAVMALGNVFILLFANTAETLLWASVCLFGIGCGPMYASIVSFYDDKISKVTNTVSGIFILGSMFNVALNTLIIGHYIIDNALILIVCNLIGAVLLLCLFGSLHALTRIKKNQRKRKFKLQQLKAFGGGGGEKAAAPASGALVGGPETGSQQQQQQVVPAEGVAQSEQQVALLGGASPGGAAVGDATGSEPPSQPGEQQAAAAQSEAEAESESEADRPQPQQTDQEPVAPPGPPAGSSPPTPAPLETPA